MSLTGVSSILWRERGLLALLLCTLEEEQLVVAARRARWLAGARREVAWVLGELRRSELRRAIEVDAVASTSGLAPTVSLRQLAEQVPAPWDDVLREHRQALLALSAEVVELARTSRALPGDVTDPGLAGDERDGQLIDLLRGQHGDRGLHRCVALLSETGTTATSMTVRAVPPSLLDVLR